MADSKRSTKKTFEERLAELESIMEWFDSDEVTLDKSIRHFEQGMKLAEELQKELVAAQNKIEHIKEKFNKLNG